MHRVYAYAIPSPMDEWVHADLPKMARSLRVQAGRIRDDELAANMRRYRLGRMAAFLDMAFAESMMLYEATQTR